MDDNRINYIDTNKEMWEITADIYQNDGFEDALQRVQENDFSTFDENEEIIFNSFIDVNNKNIIQIGCNNGTEIINLKKIGADFCLGIDISDKFIAQAKELAKMAEQNVEFESTNIYDVQSNYFGRFDLVYITVGVLGWMPDLSKFFEITNHLLKPGGQIFIYEQHPILGMFNPEPPHQMDASYFQKEPFKDEIVPEYIDKFGQYKATSYWFPYTISDILTCCLTNKLTLTHFKEYAKDLSDTYKGLENEKGQLPMSFTLIAQKV
jgi:2-polyprenyl-3-methyl-5-hydroxy-6-metoxy-1,4-benzoquinol methylase